jgi:cysteine protease ATG4
MLVNENSGASYVSDTGWGCMVRVGQMLFAEIFKYHKRMKTKEEILEMLTLFSDVDSTQPFSIHKIAELAKEEYNLKPG